MPDPAAPGRRCDVPECEFPGEFKAPKSRTALNDYHWFCLEHVRAYNAAWDFYKGMTPGEIEAQLRADTGWQRPTWPLGRSSARLSEEEIMHDPLGVLNTGRARPTEPRHEVPAELKEPLSVLGLDWPITLPEVKARYKLLAKRHHPDANGGDRTSEERLKTINLAYAALRSRLAEHAGMAPAA
jgi:hypothetical protein